VCREARGGACERHAEEVTDKKKKSMRVGDTPVGCTVGGTNTDNCAANACNVQIGNTLYCSQCKANYVPIDGTCTAAGDANTKAKCKQADGNELAGTEQVCGACKDGYFLHKGGCYKKEQQPGQTICTDASSTQGHCKVCASGYFNNPAATDSNDKESCIACGDTTGANYNKGVLNCKTCNPPSSTGSDSAPQTATCTACADGYYGTVAGSGVTCTQCTDPCATCTGAATQCTSCKDTNQYFKKSESNDGTGTCVAENACTNTHFPNDDVDGKKQCILCGDSAHGGIDGCTTCAFSQVSDQSTLTCSVCTPDTKKPNKEGTGCFVCSVDGCSNCRKDGVCEACDGKKVSPGGSSCVTNCPDSSSEQSGACICNSGFAPSGDSCAASSNVNLSTGAIVEYL
ncbi:Variant-specific surface protein, partial [Giardia duodenalis]